MRSDVKSTNQVKVGSIMQIVPDEDHGHGGKLLIVTKVESGEVRGTLPDGSEVGRTWNLVEPTGGTVVFRDGKRFSADQGEPTHHP